MIASDDRGLHDEVWLLLPWLANGRLGAADRERAEDHVRHCAACKQELAQQELMCSAFAEPDRVIYAPGPSFRKLMERIDAAPADRMDPTAEDEAGQPAARAGDRVTELTTELSKAPVTRVAGARLDRMSLWRPPGLAWAASFLLLFAVTGLLTTLYHWSAPVYSTHTDSAPTTPGVLHIALDRRLTIGDVEEMMRADGARIVEGPGDTGIVGVTPTRPVNGPGTSAGMKQELRALSARLRADPRVLWVQPLADSDTPAEPRVPVSPDR
ncbi:MAG TPA: zf-HC2 domain-containing protein [Steroidobacteraceae bacterium]|nr:zf-HC2 domain-containing protein [Steroidobacteraceae bacterium]